MYAFFSFVLGGLSGEPAKLFVSASGGSGGCLGLIGVLVDLTTAGLGDSERALGYEVPWDDDLSI